LALRLCGELPINARMRLVRIDWIQDGMELARDIPSAAVGAAPLLRRGVRLSQSLASRLSSLGIRALWIEDDMGEGIIPAMPLPDHIRAATEEAVAACFEAARAVAADLSELPFESIKQIERATDGLIEALADAPEAALAFDDLASADSYTYTHSMRVATLGLLLGQRIDRTDGWVDYRGEVRHDRMVERMTQLAMGLLVHDIGKLAIPEQVLHQFARIAAVADVYDAITADRPYQPANPPHVAVKAVREGAGTQFDPQIVDHFLRIAMPYPVGYTITLPDGSSGAVVGVDPAEPDYPVIRHRDGGAFVERALHVVDGVVQNGDTAAAA